MDELSNNEKIEEWWIKKWLEVDIYTTTFVKEKKCKFYCLDMFPYPSGSGLHVGHVEGYTASDIVSRFQRMRGLEVLHPMGWDAFGLPAENYAIQTGIHPSITTNNAIKTFKTQITSLGLSYDWGREIQTSLPEYYKWTQWFFLFLYNRGLAYKKMANVNWCEHCQTVLANEQAENGVCERCGNKVVQKDLEQWFFKITDFIEDQEYEGKKIKGLINGLDDLDWPESTKAAQKNWIGKSIGAEFELAIVGAKEKIVVFTTRIDTVFGMTYVVLAPEHELLQKLKVSNGDDVLNFIYTVKDKSELERIEGKEKNGIELKGVKAVNPFTGQEIPIFLADYVLANYGTGAVMAVPAHDARDLEFAKKYSLPIRQVIIKTNDVNADSESIDDIKANGAIEDDGVLINSDKFRGLESAVAREKMTDWLVTHGIGKKKNYYRLRDWLVSRQRFWGAPIPIVYCEKCGEQPLLEKDLPVLLPDDVDFKPTGQSPLVYSQSFHNRKCPKCGGPARMESDTMDTFVCSSWYFFRYLDPHNDKMFADPAEIKKWLPVDVYIGGAEHSVLHLLYARFFTKALQKYGLVDFNEPFLKLRHPGTILAEDGSKMSKSKGNVINPDDLVRQYGADCLRLHEMFLGTFEDSKPWSTKTIIGLKRFLKKIELISEKIKKDEDSRGENLGDLNISLNKVIKKVEDDIVEFKFNTAIAQLMILVNELAKFRHIPQSCYEKLLLILAPFAPFTAEEMWAKIGNSFSIHQQPWPKYDKRYLVDKKISIAVQINGKTRGFVEIENNEEEKSVIKRILSDNKINKYLPDGYRRVVFVTNKIINIVV